MIPTLEELAKLYEAASPRPWRVEDDGTTSLIIEDADGEPGLSRTDKHLIVALVNAWPALKARIEAADVVASIVEEQEEYTYSPLALALAAYREASR